MSNKDGNQWSSRYLLVAWFMLAIIIPSLSAFGCPLQHWVYRNIGESMVAVSISLCLP